MADSDRIRLRFETVVSKPVTPRSSLDSISLCIDQSIKSVVISLINVVNGLKNK